MSVIVSKRIVVPVLDICLGDYSEGDIVKIPENNELVEFYVAKHDYESEINGAGRTLVARKNTISSHVWHETNNNAFASSSINKYLNTTYLEQIDEKARSKILATKFYYTIGNGNSSISVLEKYVILLSLKELGEEIRGANQEGAELPTSSLLKIATSTSGNKTNQWTRSSYTLATGGAFFIRSTGTVGSATCTAKYASRPCFSLPSTTIFSKLTNVIKG